MQTSKPNPRHGVAASFNACIKSVTVASAGFLTTGAGSLLLLAVLAVPAQAAQTVRMTTTPVAVTVPLNNNTSTLITNRVIIGGGTDPVNFNVSGLPTGATASFDVNGLTASATNVLTLTTVGVAEGVYTLSIDASGGATGNTFITLQVGDVWNGSQQVSGNWSSSSSWVGGTVPGASDDVLFTDLGAQTNVFTNSIVDTSTTIGSLRFLNQTNRYEILSIASGNTLSIVGTNGFSLWRNDVNLAGTMNISFLGGGNLVVSNQNANFNLLIDNQVANTLDLSGLGTFTAFLNRMGLGDYSLYPNYYNFVTNKYSNTAPFRFIPTVFFARTNIIKTLYVDPNNYTNADNREYGVCLDNSYSSGTTTHNNINLGLSNVFFADGVCINHANEGGNLQFNPGFARSTNIVGSVTNFITNSMVAVFRGPSGGRMSMFAIGDDATPGPAVSNIKGGADFTGGTVDMLVDQIYICRDPQTISSNQTPNVQGQLSISQGIVDANNVYLGYQEHTNRYAFPEQEFRGYCEGTLLVSNTATFITHGTITLGFTADTDVNSDPGQNFGRIVVGPGGSLSANKIVVDGGAGLSTGNSININTGGTLIVSNTLAGPGQKLDSLTMTNGALTLFINGNNSTPYAYVTNFNTSGNPTINIGSIVNLTTPAQVPLVQYDAGSPTIVLGSLPGGYSGTLVNNGPGSTIDVFLSTTAPKSLAWRGFVNNNWDKTTKNWLDLNTGLQTNFATLDHVVFDDTTGVPTNINLAVTLLTPGAVNMTNTTHNYIISGSGSIVGATSMFKTGTGSLDIEGNTSLSVEVNQGLLTGAGTINAATIDSGGAMLFSGTISANVVCAGKGVSSGTISGSVDVQNGGVFTNLNAVHGPLTLENGSFMNNSGSVTYPLGFTSTVSSNAYLQNLGTISGDLLQVSGTLEDDSSPGITMTQMTITSSGTFIPGGTGIGTTSVKGNGNGNTAGRLTLASGSTTIIKVNPGQSPANTTVLAAFLDYGPSQSVQSQNGGTLILTNIDGNPFAVGQSFNIFGNSFLNQDAPGQTGSSTNSYPVMVPAQPGTGMSWDLSHLWPNGLISIITPPVVKLTNTFSIIGGTNMVGTFTWSTNVFQHWVLETQENPLSVGLSTNWTRIAGSWTNSPDDLTVGYQTRVLTNSIATTNPAVFFRLVFP